MKHLIILCVVILITSKTVICRTEFIFSNPKYDYEDEDNLLTLTKRPLKKEPLKPKIKVIDGTRIVPIDGDKEFKIVTVNKAPEDLNAFKRVANYRKRIRDNTDDRQQLLDEVIKHYLLNDPNPQNMARLQQFMKSKEDEKIEKEYEERLKQHKHSHQDLFLVSSASGVRSVRKPPLRLTYVHERVLRPIPN